MGDDRRAGHADADREGAGGQPQARRPPRRRSTASFAVPPRPPYRWARRCLPSGARRGRPATRLQPASRPPAVVEAGPWPKRTASARLSRRPGSEVGSSALSRSPTHAPSAAASNTSTAEVQARCPCENVFQSASPPGWESVTDATTDLAGTRTGAGTVVGRVCSPLVALIDAVDRGILPGVLTKVQDDLGFSDTQAGFLGTAFVLTGFLVVLPAGYLADRYVRTRIIAVVLGVVGRHLRPERRRAQLLAVPRSCGPRSASARPSTTRPRSRSSPTTTAPRCAAGRSPSSGSRRSSARPSGLGLGWRDRRPSWAGGGPSCWSGVPGSLLASPCGGSRAAAGRERRGTARARGAALPVVGSGRPDREAGVAALLHDVRDALRVRTLRSLMIGSAIAAGALSGFGFWAPAFYERHAVTGLRRVGRHRRGAHPRRAPIAGTFARRAARRPAARPLRGSADAARRCVPGSSARSCSCPPSCRAAVAPDAGPGRRRGASSSAACRASR